MSLPCIRKYSRYIVFILYTKIYQYIYIYSHLNTEYSIYKYKLSLVHVFCTAVTVYILRQYEATYSSAACESCADVYGLSLPPTEIRKFLLIKPG